jgi:hypothetical protein
MIVEAMAWAALTDGVLRLRRFSIRFFRAVDFSEIDPFCNISPRPFQKSI